MSHITAEQIIAAVAVSGVAWAIIIFIFSPLADKLFVRQFKRNQAELQLTIAKWFAANIMINESNTKAIDKLLEHDKELTEDLITDRKETKEMFNKITDKLEDIQVVVNQNSMQTQYLRGLVEKQNGGHK